MLNRAFGCWAADLGKVPGLPAQKPHKHGGGVIDAGHMAHRGHRRWAFGRWASGTEAPTMGHRAPTMGHREFDEILRRYEVPVPLGRYGVEKRPGWGLARLTLQSWRQGAIAARESASPWAHGQAKTRLTNGRPCGHEAQRAQWLPRASRMVCDIICQRNQIEPLGQGV